jgi:hypothetical protein
MSARPALRDVETCEIGWWRGYVKGRFQAYLVSPDGSRLIAESPPIAWRSSTAPGPTEAAVRALGVLTELLVAQGWTVTDATAEPWFRLSLARPAGADNGATAEDDPPTAKPPPARKRRRPTQAQRRAADVAVLDEALLEQLRSELEGARRDAQRERDRRLEAEQKALRLVEPARATAHPAQPLPTPVLFAVYAIAVVAAALVGLVGFESGYGAAVAALTVLALSIAVDSWIAARRRTALSH